jgi:hypothetical protein
MTSSPGELPWHRFRQARLPPRADRPSRGSLRAVQHPQARKLLLIAFPELMKLFVHVERNAIDVFEDRLHRLQQPPIKPSAR